MATREAVRASTRLRRHRGNPLDDVAELAEPSPENFPELADEELLADLPARLAALPVGTQVVLRLHYLQSLTQQEVAEALAIPLGTVKSRLAYGLSFLRKQWTSPHSP